MPSTPRSDADVNAARRQAQIRVAGFDPPRPVMDFALMGLDKHMMGVIAKQGYTKPTPIQCQAIPAALSGESTRPAALAPTHHGPTRFRGAGPRDGFSSSREPANSPSHGA